MKYLITNADDYGYRFEVSKAIAQSNNKGILTSTTVLVNFITEEEVTLAKNTPTLALGLHLNLTSGKPITSNWLNRYGEFSRPKRNEPEQFNRELWIPFFSQFAKEDIYLEYKAQLEKFIELFDKLPTHLDAHHYHSAFPNTFDAFTRLAQENNLAVRNQVLFDFAANQHVMGNIDHIPSFNRELINKNIKTTNYFSLLYLNRYENYLEVISNELDKIEDEQSIELSFHPGLEEDWRRKDLAILLDKEFANLLKSKSIKLITYADLPKTALS